MEIDKSKVIQFQKKRSMQNYLNIRIFLKMNFFGKSNIHCALSYFIEYIYIHDKNYNSDIQNDIPTYATYSINNKLIFLTMRRSIDTRT